MQTETFGQNMIPPDKIDINAAKYSDAHICALMIRQFPGHWLPNGKDQIIKDAKPYFKLISLSNGALDSIETQKRWQKKYTEFSSKKYLSYLSLIPTYISNKEFRRRIANFWINANIICLERKMIDQYRFVFEKVTIKD